MLLVTHPEIEGDPDQEPMVWSGSDITAFFEYTVTIEEKSVTLLIGIDERPYKTANENKTYGETMEIREGKEYQIALFQKVFSSVAFLFHIVGHEGQHVIDYIKKGKEGVTEPSAYAWNARNDYVPPYYLPFPLKRREFGLPPRPR